MDTGLIPGQFVPSLDMFASQGGSWLKCECRRMPGLKDFRVNWANLSEACAWNSRSRAYKKRGEDGVEGFASLGCLTRLRADLWTEVPQTMAVLSQGAPQRAISRANKGADSCPLFFLWQCPLPQHIRPNGWSCAFCWPLSGSCVRVSSRLGKGHIANLVSRWPHTPFSSQEGFL